VKMRKWEWKERENVKSVFFSLFLWVSLSRNGYNGFTEMEGKSREFFELCNSILCNDVVWKLVLFLYYVMMWCD
jgi:hypothetical protein